MAKENSSEARVERIRVNPGKQSLRLRKSIPLGLTTENAPACLLEVRAKGTENRPFR